MADIKLLKLRAKAKAKAQREREVASSEPEDEEFTGVKAFINAVSPTAVKMWDAFQNPETDEERTARENSPEFKAEWEGKVKAFEEKPFLAKALDKPQMGNVPAGGWPNVEAPLQVAGETLDVPRRALGAGVGSIPGFAQFVGRKENQDFLDAMADPSTGIFKLLKDAVRSGDSSKATKIALDFGLTIAEDPLILFTGIYKAGLAMRAIKVKDAARAGVAAQGVKASDDIMKSTAVPELGGIPKGNLDPAMQFTPVQQSTVMGDDVVKSVLKKEEKALGKTNKAGVDVRKGIDKNNAKAVANQLRGIKTKYGFSDDAVDGVNPVSKFRKEAEEKLGSLKTKFDDEMAGVFNKIDGSLDDVGKIDDEAINIVSSKIDDVTKTEKITTTTPGATETLPRKIPDDPELVAELFRKGELIPGPGNSVVWAEGFGDEAVQLADDAITISKQMQSAAQLGVTKSTINRLKDLNIRIKQGLKFSELKTERAKLGDFLYGGKSEASRSLPVTDYKMLKDVYKGLTASMESMVGKNLGDDVLREWKATNKLYSATSQDFKIAQKIMNKKSTSIIIDDLASKTKKGIDRGIKSLVSVMPGENLKAFKNMYFNHLINKATKKGGVDGDLLTQVLREQPPIVFNEIFDAKMIDDLVDLGKNSKAAKVAMESAVKANTKPSIWKEAWNNPWVRIAMMRGKEPSTIVLSQVARVAGQGALAKRSAKKAEAFLRQVDQASLIPGFLKGTLLGGKLETLKYPTTRPEVEVDDPMGFGVK